MITKLLSILSLILFTIFILQEIFCYIKKTNAPMRYYLIALYRKLFLPKDDELGNKLDKLYKYDNDYIISRVDYYNKLKDKFKLKKSYLFNHFRKINNYSIYPIDLWEYLRFFSQKKFKGINVLFGDVINVPIEPSIVKSRPINIDNTYSIVLNLDKRRHFNFIFDNINFLNKKNILLYRGAAYQEHRVKFIKKWSTSNLCNIKDTKNSKKEYMTIPQQLEYKFILSLEGNDVATNTKWIMASNSLCFMPKPKYETWFMEGKLIPNYHYVLINNDYSNVEELIKYYIKNTHDALKIINNAHTYIQQFKNQEREDIISLLVLKKYFDLQK
jgi:hypothetical protein